MIYELIGMAVTAAVLGIIGIVSWVGINYYTENMKWDRHDRRHEQWPDWRLRLVSLKKGEN